VSRTSANRTEYKSSVLTKSSQTIDVDNPELAVTITPVTLLSGFLGSGKTTVLAHALEQPALSNAVVIINEFGEVGIDHLIVADLAENILELRNGCLCCTIRGDLVMTLRDLHRRRQLQEIKAFNQVVVEARPRGSRTDRTHADGESANHVCLSLGWHHLCRRRIKRHKHIACA
jgi:hypothetical protein